MRASIILLGLLAGAFAAGHAQAQSAGVVQFAAGDVKVIAASGAERVARKGVPVSVGDTLLTARGALAQLKMGDGAIIVVQPQSRLTVAEFHYAGKEDGTENVRYRLENGGFRAVTGAIGRTHKQNYIIETPIAHMGVRGTDHESYYFPASGPVPGDGAKHGAYNKVNTGRTFIRTGVGEIEIDPNQVGYVAGANQVPVILPGVPGFFNQSIAPRSAQPAVNPAPAAAQFVKVEQTVKTSDGENLIVPSGQGAPTGSAGGPLPGTGGTTTPPTGSPGGSLPGTGGTTTPPTGSPGGSLPGTGGTTTPPVGNAEGPLVGYATSRGAANFGHSAAGAAVAASNGATWTVNGEDAVLSVKWGTWAGGTVNVGGELASGPVHQIDSSMKTSAATLGSLAASNVTGTYSFAPGNGVVGNSLGNAGTIDKLEVGVDFGKQMITSYDLQATVAGTWKANGSGSFAQFTGGSGIPLTGDCTGCAGGGSPTASGTAHGAFVGDAAQKMITSFGLDANARHAISGAALLDKK